MGELVVPGGKGSMTEAGARVPFIAKWPDGIKSGQVSEKLLSLVDLEPTFNAMAGIKTGKGVSGRDLSHYFTGGEGEDRDHVFVCYGRNYFVRTDKWRLHNTGDLYYIPVSSNEERYAEKKKQSEKHRAKLQAMLDSYGMERYTNAEKKRKKKAGE